MRRLGTGTCAAGMFVALACCGPPSDYREGFQRTAEFYALSYRSGTQDLHAPMDYDLSRRLILSAAKADERTGEILVSRFGLEEFIRQYPGNIPNVNRGELSRALPESGWLPITDSPEKDRAPAFSPDAEARYVAFLSESETGAKVFVYDSLTERTTQVPAAPQERPLFARWLGTDLLCVYFQGSARKMYSVENRIAEIQDLPAWHESKYGDAVPAADVGLRAWLERAASSAGKRGDRSNLLKTDILPITVEQRIVLPGVEGADTPLPVHPGRPALYNVFETWCRPCRAEMPVLEAFAAEFSGIDFVVLTRDDNGDTATYVGERAFANLTFVIDKEGEIIRRFCDHCPIPLTALADPSGNIVFTHAGEDLFLDDGGSVARSVLEELVGQEKRNGSDMD